MKKAVFFLVIFISFAIIFFAFLDVKADSGNYFTGLNGSPIDDDLYNATNTFQYNGNNTSGASDYVYYDTSNNNNNLIKTGSPQITVLTHGLAGDASHWSNNGNNEFSYDNSSIISRINDELYINTGSGTNIYWAIMQSSTSFKLYDLNNSSNINNLNVYKQTQTITQINDISKHIIIIFESSMPEEYNYKVYEEFNYMLSKIVYDVKQLNNGYLPKINLIGHSRGGLTNLEYVLDHPMMIDSVFSLGTPYFGSNTGSTELAKYLVGDSNGLDDIIDRNIYLSYFNRWYNGYNSLYSNINYHALGGFSDSDFVFDAIIDDYDSLHCEEIITINQLKIFKNAIKTLPGLTSEIENTADLANFLLSLFRNENYDEAELESYIEILSNIQYACIDSNSSFWTNIWDNIIHNIPILGSPYFMNDLLVDLTSQVGFDEHSDSYRDYGFIQYQKCFKNNDYENQSKKLSSNSMPAVVHNLEAYDYDLINYILSNINLGFNDTYIYEVVSNNNARIVGYRGNINVNSITIPCQIDGHTVVEIGSHVFHNCVNAITSIIIPNTVITIYSEAFIGMLDLEEVIINSNSSLTYIGERAFAGCYNLIKFGNTQNSLVVPNNVTYIGEYAFFDTDFEYITIGSSALYIGGGAFSNIGSLINISVNQNSSYFSDNGILYSNTGYIIQYPLAKNLSSFIIPSTILGISIVGINDNAFMNATLLSSIDLNQIEFIGKNAFLGCNNMTSITIPSTVASIGMYAFKNCLLLNNVTVLCEQSPITSLGTFAFDNCAFNLTITVPTNRLCEYKNTPFWSSYRDKIVPSSPFIDDIDLDCMVDDDVTTYLNAGYNKLYRLDVDCDGWYTISCTSDTHFNIYNSNMVKIVGSYDTYELTLNEGTYYIDVEWEDPSDYGYATLHFLNKGINVSSVVTNNILPHLHLVGVNEYRVQLKYYNNQGPSFYNISVNATSINPITYNEGTITFYSDYSRTTIINKYSDNNYTLSAKSSYGSNNMAMYFHSNGYYYFDVILNTNDLTALTLNINPLTSTNLNLFDLSTSTDEGVELLSSDIKGDYFKKVLLQQSAKFELTGQYKDYSSENAYVLVARIVPLGSSYSLDVKLISIINDNIISASELRNLEPGTYYIGYFNNIDGVEIGISFERKITQYGSYNLISDPNSFEDYGSEVRFNNGAYLGTTLTVGFTRFIYLNYDYILPSYSRLDYNFYSSNESIATISEYGTLLGRSPGTIKIMAVYKNDPSIVYVKEFTVLNDNRINNLIIYNTDTIAYLDSGQLYQIELDDYNSFFPQVSLYNWTLISSSNNYTYNISEWGTFQLIGEDIIVIEGTSKLNSKIKIRLTLTVTN